MQPGIAIPDFRGQSTQEAIAFVERNGMRANLVRGGEMEAPSPDLVGVSLVRAQSYSPGRVVPMKRSTVIGLQSMTYVEPRVAVPSLKGMHPDDARRIAENSRLNAQQMGYGATTIPTNDSRLDGQLVVTQQQIRPGARVPVGTTIGYAVGRYELQIRVPNLRGMDPQQAQQTAAGAGLAMRQSRQIAIPTNDTYYLEFDRYEVTDQSPRAGTTAPRGTTISVVVGKYTWQRPAGSPGEGITSPDGIRIPSRPSPGIGFPIWPPRTARPGGSFSIPLQ